MPGVGAVYGSVRALPTPARVGAWLPDGRAQVVEGSEEDWSRLEIRWPDLAVSLQRLAAGEAGHAEQVRALWSAVLQTAQERLEGAITPRLHKLMRKIAGARHVIGVAAEPGPPGPETIGRVEAVLRAVTTELNGVAFRDGRVLDGSLRVLLAPDGGGDDAAELPDLAAARDRKARSEERLRALGVAPPELPALPSEDEVVLREPAEVAGRAQALWAVAARAGGIERDDAVDLLQKRGLWDAATEREQAFLLDEEPALRERVHYAAQADALRCLLWALRRLDDLEDAPSQPVGLDALTRVLVGLPAATFLAEAVLRPLEEVLDAADLAYRAHGATARTGEGEETPGGLHAQVVEARHVAFFWLIRYMEQPWDVLASNPGD